MTEADHKRAREVLAFTLNVEHAGDVVDKNLLVLAAKKIRRCLAFSGEGQAELLGAVDRLIANTRAAASLFVTENARGPPARRREGGIPRHRGTGHNGALRAPAHEPDRDGGDRCAPPRHPARPQAGQRAPGRRGRLSGAGRQGRAAAEPPQAGRGR